MRFDSPHHPMNTLVCQPAGHFAAGARGRRPRGSACRARGPREGELPRAIHQQRQASTRLAGPNTHRSRPKPAQGNEAVSSFACARQSSPTAPWQAPGRHTAESRLPGGFRRRRRHGGRSTAANVSGGEPQMDPCFRSEIMLPNGGRNGRICSGHPPHPGF